MQAQRKKTRDAVMAILTTDQKDKVDAFLKDHPRPGGGPGGFDPGGPGGGPGAPDDGGPGAPPPGGPGDGTPPPPPDDAA
jgi:hypothetical protein